MAPVIAAAVGAMTLLWAEGQAVERAFALLWVGDATGVLVAAPAVITFVDSWRRRSRPAADRLLEALAFAMAIGVVAVGSLSGRLPFGLIFLPLVLMAAARFHYWGSVLSVLTLAALIGLFEVVEVNPFLFASARIESNVQQQVFLAIAAFSTLVVASLAKQNAVSLRLLSENNLELERRVAERTASLSASEGRLRRMMETAQVGIAFGDSTLAVTHANANLAVLLGRSAAQLEERRTQWLELCSVADRTRLADALAQLEADGRVNPTEFELERPDGATVPAIFSAARLDNGDHVFFVVDQTEQKRQADQIRLLMHEMNHRAKNLLAVVLSVARQTKAATHTEFMERFEDRLHALGSLQDLLINNAWQGAQLEAVVRTQFAHFGDVLEGRISIEGPPIQLSPAASQTIAMAIHELATNAVKYGALSNEVGKISIVWKHTANGRLVLEWVETAGPPVAPSNHRGFGSVVVHAMASALEGCSARSDFEPTGLRWTLEGPMLSFTVV